MSLVSMARTKYSPASRGPLVSVVAQTVKRSLFISEAKMVQCFHGCSYMSSVQNPGWLFDIGDYTTQLYGEYFLNHYKDPYYITIQYNGMSTGFGSRCSHGAAATPKFDGWRKVRGNDFQHDVHGSGDRHRSFPGGI